MQSSLFDGLAFTAGTRTTERSIHRLIEVALRHLADWCALDLEDRAGRPQRVACGRRLEDGEVEISVGREGEEALAPALWQSLSRTAHPQVLQTPDAAAFRDTGAPAGSTRIVLLPLLTEGALNGAVTLAGTERLPPDDEHVLRQLADGLSARLVNIRLVEELEATNARLQAIIDHAPVLIYVKDAEGRYELVSQSFAARHGLRPAELIGKTDWEIHPESAARLRAHDQQVLGEGRSLQVEEEVATAEGVHVSIAEKFPIPSLDGRGLAVCGISTDITERKRAERELVRTAEFRERLLGIVSHDLRNPLNAILLSAATLLRREDLSEGASRGVRRILTSGDRMLGIISDLLDFTRGRLGAGIPVERTQLDLLPLLQDVVSELEVANPSRELLFDSQGDLFGCFDGARVAQALGNLIRNAIRYGDPQSTVTIRARAAEGDRVCIDVHNEGEPIADDVRAHLFDAFWQAGNGRGGLGLGLYIVQEIVRAHGGEVEVQSEKGHGTTFTLVLPRGLRKS